MWSSAILGWQLHKSAHACYGCTAKNAAHYAIAKRARKQLLHVLLRRKLIWGMGLLGVATSFASKRPAGFKSRMLHHTPGKWRNSRRLPNEGQRGQQDGYGGVAMFAAASLHPTYGDVLLGAGASPAFPPIFAPSGGSGVGPSKPDLAVVRLHHGVHSLSPPTDSALTLRRSIVTVRLRPGVPYRC